MELQGLFAQYGVVLLVLVVFFAGQVIGPILRPVISLLAGIPVY
jgi:hypothetical protein